MWSHTVNVQKAVDLSLLVFLKSKTTLRTWRGYGSSPRKMSLLTKFTSHCRDPWSTRNPPSSSEYSISRDKSQGRNPGEHSQIMSQLEKRSQAGWLRWCSQRGERRLKSRDGRVSREEGDAESNVNGSDNGAGEGLRAEQQDLRNS